jgi:hypothetical protein
MVVDWLLVTTSVSRAEITWAAVVVDGVVATAAVVMVVVVVVVFVVAPSPRDASTLAIALLMLTVVFAFVSAMPGTMLLVVETVVVVLLDRNMVLDEVVVTVFVMPLRYVVAAVIVFVTVTLFPALVVCAVLLVDTRRATDRETVRVDVVVGLHGDICHEVVSVLNITAKVLFRKCQSECFEI